jgi:hypothetical protein
VRLQAILAATAVSVGLALPGVIAFQEAVSYNLVPGISPTRSSLLLLAVVAGAVLIGLGSAFWLGWWTAQRRSRRRSGPRHRRPLSEVERVAGIGFAGSLLAACIGAAASVAAAAIGASTGR